MLSRVANLVYWMARYLERAENAARIVDVNAQLVLDLQTRQMADDPRSWEPLVYVSGGDKEFHKLYGKEITERTVVDFMLFDRRNSSSVLSCVCSARENARCIRDQLSADVWEELNTFYLKLKDDDYTRYTQLGSSEYLNRLKTRIQLFYGIADSMIPRTQMWWFFELGRFLERADNTSRILDVKYYMLLPDLSAVGSALDIVQWASVLRTCSAYEAFRRSRRGQLSLERVVDYLVRDETFPRSIHFSVQQAQRALEHITGDVLHLDKNNATALTAQLQSHLEHSLIEEVITGGLHEFLDDVQLKLSDIHDGIQDTFINYPSAGANVLA